MSTETPKQELAREKAEEKAADKREDARLAAPNPATPYSAPQAPTVPVKTQNQKDWEDEIARTKPKVKIDAAGAEKLRAEVANQPNPSDDAAQERERLGMIALARAAAMVKKRKHEEEARIKEANDTVAIS